jgi:hypothetical protein
MKKLIYLLVIAIGLAATVAADGPWPNPCWPNCTDGK